MKRIKNQLSDTKLQTFLIAASLAFGAANASEVAESDPVPGDGISYRWTVSMEDRDHANLKGTVGAWSWDEDGFPATAKGWTHTSNWIAFELKRDARLTIELKRASGIPTGSGPSTANPDGNGLFNLFPAFSIYRGWQDSGADSHNFNNRGDIAWANEVSYLTHVENNGGHRVTRTFKLRAGKYSIVMGGNSPSTDAEGRQGYEANLSTDFYMNSSKIKTPGNGRIVTKRRSYKMSGRISNPRVADRMKLTCNGRSRKARMRGGSWSARLTGLRKGRNRVRAVLYSQDERAKDSKVFRVMRMSPVSGNGGKPAGLNFVR